jgi:hypothetical protein
MAIIGDTAINFTNMPKIQQYHYFRLPMQEAGATADIEMVYIWLTFWNNLAALTRSDYRSVRAPLSFFWPLAKTTLWKLQNARRPHLWANH